VAFLGIQSNEYPIPTITMQTDFAYPFKKNLQFFETLPGPGTPKKKLFLIPDRVSRKKEKRKRKMM
jgi:hypothetical protein